MNPSTPKGYAETQWISVSDRLPANNEKVIVYGRFDEDWFVDDCWFRKDYKGPWPYKLEPQDRWTIYPPRCCDDELFWDEVSHWQPLPEKP